MTGRLFPPPWSIEETAACYIVRDSDGQALAYVYYEEIPAGDRRPSCSARTKRGG